MPFRHITGHRHLLDLIARATTRGTLPPSVIFAGPEGVGKRTAAVALAQLMNCTAHDMVPRSKPRSEPEMVSLFGLRSEPDIVPPFELRSEADLFPASEFRSEPDMVPPSELRSEADMVPASELRSDAGGEDACGECPSCKRIAL